MWRWRVGIQDWWRQCEGLLGWRTHQLVIRNRRHNHMPWSPLLLCLNSRRWEYVHWSQHKLQLTKFRIDLWVEHCDVDCQSTTGGLIASEVSDQSSIYNRCRSDSRSDTRRQCDNHPSWIWSLLFGQIWSSHSNLRDHDHSWATRLGQEESIGTMRRHW